MSTATNEITGDKIQTRTISDAYRENFDKIFRANKPESAEIVGYVFYCIPIPLGAGKTTHILFRSEFSDDSVYVV